MNFQVLQTDLSETVSKAVRFASSRAQLPVLGNILLRTDKNKLIIASTNLEVSFATSIGAQIEKEGEITIPARTAHELFSALKTGQIEVNVEKEIVTVVADSFVSTLSGMNASDFPNIPLVPKKGSLELNIDVLSHALSKVSFAVSTDETRPILTGVLMLFEKESITLVSTDGFRLSKYELPLENSFEGSERFIIPKNPLVELPKLESTLKELNIFFDKDNNQIVFSSGKNTLATRIIEGEFPNYEKIIPKSTLYEITVGKDELVRAVKLASIFARDSANVVTFTLKKQKLELSAKSASKGTQTSIVEADIDSSSEDSLTIAFNCKFLEDFLTSVKGSNVKMKFTDSQTAGLFLDLDEPTYLHLIMPVKL